MEHAPTHRQPSNKQAPGSLKPQEAHNQLRNHRILWLSMAGINWSLGRAWSVCSANGILCRRTVRASRLKKQETWQHPVPPPKKKNDRPKAPKGPQQQGEKKEKRKKKKKVVLLSPATEEVQSNQKQAEGTASSLIKRWFCLLSRYRRGAKQPKTGWRHRIILDKKVDLLIVPLPKWFNATKNWLKAPPHPEWV